MIRITRLFTRKWALTSITLFAVCLNNIYAQNLLEDAGVSFAAQNSGNLFTETIKIISRSGKIFILTNGNQLLNKGDFITLVLKDDGPVARAVVAKTHDGSAGIKVLKVYSLNRWKKLVKGLDIQILKGDDSHLFKPKVDASNAQAPDTSIDSEEDLFNDKSLVGDDSLGDIYNDSRLIKPDNVISIAWDQFNYIDEVSEDKRVANQFNYAWAYQFSDNYWVEGLYGRVNLENVPANGKSTLIHNFTVRAKYTFNAPFYSYVMPYVGFQTYLVSSPQAGEDVDAAEAELEDKTVDNLKKSQIIVGVTYLKRLVPGWFLKAEFGTDDIFGLGVAIEF